MICLVGDAQAALDRIVQNVNFGGSPGHLEIWTGTGPSTVAASPTGTLLANCTCSNPSFGAFGASSGNPPVAVGNVSAGTFAVAASAAATGTAGYFRIKDAWTGSYRMQGTIGLTGSGADLELSSLSITAGSAVTITSFNATLSGIS